MKIIHFIWCLTIVFVVPVNLFVQLNKASSQLITETYVGKEIVDPHRNLENLKDTTKTPIEGVWKITEVVIPGSNPAAEKATTITNPEPGLLIFTRGYYSTIAVHELRTAVAPAKDPRNLTDSEKIALYEQWKPFTANSGTYEINASTLTRRSIVAKNVNAMTKGAPNIQEFKLEGPNTLWLLPIASAPANEPRIKLTRLE